MNNDVFRLVQQSVEAHSMTDDERLLEALRITRDKELPPMHFLFRIFGKPCFPRGGCGHGVPVRTRPHPGAVVRHGAERTVHAGHPEEQAAEDD